MTLQELSDILLTNPFDDDSRRLYAQALYREGRYQDSLVQWKLLLDRADDKQPVLEMINRINAALNTDTPDANPAPQDIEVDGPAGLRLVAGTEVAAEKPAQPNARLQSDTVRFSDIVGMADLKKLVRRRIIDPFVSPGLFERFKRRAGGGVMLYGPPGCGKTMLAKAIATECKASFYAVGISDVLNMYIGESEGNLRELFDNARANRPSVLFFDELDALAYSRSRTQSSYARTLVNEFLNQLDGMQGSNDQILILGATNMPWDVDAAMKRPGRFDRQIFVPPPDTEALAAMLQAKLKDVPTQPFDAMKVAARCRNFSGADIDGLIESAKDSVIDDIMETDRERGVGEADLLAATDQITASTSDWLNTAQNLVKYGGARDAYKELAAYLRATRPR